MSATPKINSKLLAPKTSSLERSGNNKLATKKKSPKHPEIHRNKTYMSYREEKRQEAEDEAWDKLFNHLMSKPLKMKPEFVDKCPGYKKLIDMANSNQSVKEAVISMILAEEYAEQQEKLLKSVRAELKIPCIIYALDKLCCPKHILETLESMMTTKFAKANDLDTLFKEVGICVRIDEEMPNSEKNKYKTTYIGKDKESCVYFGLDLCLDYSGSVYECEDEIPQYDREFFRDKEDVDYFRIGLVHEGKYSHYFANSVVPISPYFFKHYDEIEKYAKENNKDINDLLRVNKCVNGNYYTDKSHKSTSRMFDLIKFTREKGWFSPYKLDDIRKLESSFKYNKDFF